MLRFFSSREHETWAPTRQQFQEGLVYVPETANVDHIAKEHNLDVDGLRARNPSLPRVPVIIKGTSVWTGEIHCCNPGEGWYDVARESNVTEAAIRALNTGNPCIKDQRRLQPGDIVWLPKRKGQDEKQKAALQEAAWNGDIWALRLLISQGVDINTPLGNDNTALHLAAYTGQLQTVQFLLSAGALARVGPVMFNYKRETPLHAAAWSGTPEVCEVLLKHRPDLLPLENIKGETALDLAVRNNQKCVDALKPQN